MNHPALARETYVQFAQRIAGQLPKGSKYRADLEKQLFAEANRFRASKGVQALRDSGEFRLAARAQAVDMMLNNFVGHRSSHGEEFGSRMSAFLGGGMMMMMPHMAENAARETQPGPVDAAKASRLFQQWVKSTPHRKALVNSDFKFVSTGVVERGNNIYAVQIFWNQLPKGMTVKGSETGGLTPVVPVETPPADNNAGSLY